MLRMFGWLLVVNPIVAVIIGLSGGPDGTSAAGYIVGGSWTLCALLYTSKDIWISDSKAIKKFTRPMLLLCAVMFVREFLVGAKQDGFSAGLVGGVDSCARPLYFIVSVVVAYKLAKKGLLHPKLLANLSICGGLILSAAIIAGRYGLLGTHGTYDALSDPANGAPNTLFHNSSGGALAMVLYGLVGAHGRKRSFIFLWIFAISIVVAMTGNRTGMLACGVAALIYGVIMHGRKNSFRRTVLRLVAVTGFIGITAAAIGMWFPAEFNRWNDTSGSGRVVFQAIVIQDVVQRPISGLMFGNGRMDVRKLLGATYGMEIYSHSDYLEAIAGYGLLGLVLFLLGIGGLLYMCFQGQKGSVFKIECRAAVVILIVAMLTEVVLADGLYTLILSAVIGTMVAHSRKLSQPPPLGGLSREL